MERLSLAEGKAFFAANHYAKGVGNAAMLFGQRGTDGNLVAVAAYAVPCSQVARKSPLGEEYHEGVYTLQRLARVAQPPEGFVLSAFLAQSLKAFSEYRPNAVFVTAFSDTTEGHHGGIYQATNWLYFGTTGGRAKFWLDADGRLRHPRQCGVNVDGVSKGWTPVMRESKHRYGIFIGNKRARKAASKSLLWTPQDYPKPSAS